MSQAFLMAIAAVQELSAQLDDEVPGVQALVDRIQAAEQDGNDAEAWRLAAILFEILSAGTFRIH